MEDTHEKLYQEIASQEASEPAPLSYARHLQRIALHRAQSTEKKERLGALRVAIALPTSHGMPMIRELLLDAESSIREHAYAHAVALEEEGIPLLRRVTEGDDLALATDALKRLVKADDRGSVALMRRLLDSVSADIRAGAASLLGVSAGPAVVPQLTQLATHDPDEGVREAASQALEIITGEKPGSSEPKSDTSSGDAEGAVAPVADLPEPDPKTGHLPLPSPMPGEPELLLTLLGGCAPGDREQVLNALSEHLEAVGEAMARFSDQGSPLLGAGLGVAAAHFARPAWAQSLRRLLQDARAQVKSEAARAMGAVGGLGQIPQIQGLLADANADVRLAAVEGLNALCARFERLDLARGRIEALAEDADARVKAAVAAILGA